MNRLRRRSGALEFAPLAAEVLPTRTLLSAGAAAAHAAVHHAGAQPGSGIGSDAQSVNVSAFLSLNNGTPVQFQGTIVVTHLGTAIGSRITAHFQGTANTGGQTASVKISFSGKITQITGPSDLQTFTLQRTGGSLALTVQTPGTRPLHVRSAFSDPLFFATSGKGALDDIKDEFGFSAGAPLPYSGGAMAVHIPLVE
jgi:hypothetical protein